MSFDGDLPGKFYPALTWIFDCYSEHGGEGVVRCAYHEKSAGLLVYQGDTVGYRTDYQGVMLLDTVLNRGVLTPNGMACLELLYFEVSHTTIFTEYTVIYILDACV